MSSPAPTTVTRASGKVKACCLVEENLVVIESRAHVEVKRCRECSCRHFRAFMQPREPGTFVEV